MFGGSFGRIGGTTVFVSGTLFVAGDRGVGNGEGALLVVSAVCSTPGKTVETGSESWPPPHPAMNAARSAQHLVFEQILFTGVFIIDQGRSV